jgi:hypothetical protein
MELPLPLDVLAVDDEPQLAKQRVCEQFVRHAGLAVNAPKRKLDLFNLQGLMPGERADTVDKGAIEDRKRRRRGSPAFTAPERQRYVTPQNYRLSLRRTAMTIINFSPSSAPYWRHCCRTSHQNGVGADSLALPPKHSRSRCPLGAKSERGRADLLF